MRNLSCNVDFLVLYGVVALGRFLHAKVPVAKVSYGFEIPVGMYTVVDSDAALDLVDFGSAVCIIDNFEVGDGHSEHRSELVALFERDGVWLAVFVVEVDNIEHIGCLLGLMCHDMFHKLANEAERYGGVAAFEDHAVLLRIGGLVFGTAAGYASEACHDSGTGCNMK